MTSPKPVLVEIEDWMVLDEDARVMSVEQSQPYITVTRDDPTWEYLREPASDGSIEYSPLIVGLFGPSGSGKDFVADIISDKFGDDLTSISSDSYYGPGGMEYLGKKLYFDTYDIPGCYDWELLKEHLNMLRKGKTVKVPEYDFTIHSRRENEFTEVGPNRIILISGILVAHVLNDVLDLIVGVSAPWETCVERRINRDVRERGRTRPQCVKQIESTVKPGYKDYVEPYLICKEINGCKVCIVDNSKDVDIEGGEKPEIEEEFVEVIRGMMRD